MSGRGASWFEINGAVEELVAHHVENDPTVNGYLIALSGLLVVKDLHGRRRAAEIAYRLADELAAAGAA